PPGRPGGGEIIAGIASGFQAAHVLLDDGGRSRRRGVPGAVVPVLTIITREHPTEGPAMPVSRTYCAIHDDQYGVGTELAFPTMSSCAACVVVLDDRLVGIHKTQGWHRFSKRAFQLAAREIWGHRMHRLYIAGWNVGSPESHNIDEIRRALGCLATFP